jgi:hypothetical protein
VSPTAMRRRMQRIGHVQTGHAWPRSVAIRPAAETFLRERRVTRNGRNYSAWSLRNGNPSRESAEPSLTSRYLPLRLCTRSCHDAWVATHAS